MDLIQKLSSRCVQRSNSCSWILTFLLIVYGSDWILPSLFVNGQDLFQPIEANSSPPHITGIKGSSVWLHWNYTYIGDGTRGGVTSAYKEQVIGFNSSSDKNIQPLAKRISQNGPITLQSPIPAPFNGRIEVIPSNSTLVIHRLQYNDSFYQYASTVTANLLIGGTTSPFTNYLKPVVSLTINGLPDFLLPPPKTFEVSENSNLVISIEMDGNPKPSADFKWTHLPTSSITHVPSVQLYPFVYSSTYSLSNIDGRFCGRILQTTLKNSIGSSSVMSTNVTVLLKLDQDLSLKSGKIGGDNCIEVKWNKVESGACFVKYDVAFKTSFGSYFHTKTGYNIAEIKICNVKNYANITDVQLTVSFKSTSNIATARVSKTHITTPAPTTKTTYSYSSDTDQVNTQTSSTLFTSTVITTACQECKNSSSDKWDARDSALVAVIGILLIVIIIMLIMIITMRRWLNSERANHTQSGEKRQPDMHYMDLQTRSIENDPNYAKLQADYEEVGQRNPHYVNA